MFSHKLVAVDHEGSLVKVQLVIERITKSWLEWPFCFGFHPKVDLTWCLTWKGKTHEFKVHWHTVLLKQISNQGCTRLNPSLTYGRATIRNINSGDSSKRSRATVMAVPISWTTHVMDMITRKLFSALFLIWVPKFRTMQILIMFAVTERKMVMTVNGMSTARISGYAWEK